MQKILVITGSTRPNRKSEQVAKWFIETAQAQNSEDFTFELIDIAKVDLPMFDEALPPMMGQYQNDHTKEWAKVLGSADGYVIVAPEYNHGYPAALKNAIDYLYAEWNRKPVGFVSYGVAGGVRSVEQLKQVFVQLDTVPINTQVSFNLFTSFGQDGALNANDHDAESAGKLLAELKWWGETLKAGREKTA
jgi:NAD(P)H-dependent FMN reductase